MSLALKCPQGTTKKTQSPSSLSKRSTRVQYRVSVLGHAELGSSGKDRKPLPYFPAWLQEFHPFHIQEGKLKGPVRNARCLVQPARLWSERGRRKILLDSAEAMLAIVDQGRRTPHLRLPDTAALVTVTAQGGMPSHGMLHGTWAIEPLPRDEMVLAIPETWRVNEQLGEFLTKNGLDTAQIEQVENRVLGFALQPWRMSFYWPHPDWWYEWQYSSEAKTTVVPECLYAHWQEEPPFEAGSWELAIMSLALAGRWLATKQGVEKLPEGLTVHTCGVETRYVNARLINAA